MNDPPPRAVKRSAQFDAQAEAIEPNLVRFDEAFRGIEWVLARSPLSGTVYVVLALGPQGSLVKVTAIISDEQATLTGIELVSESEQQL